MWEPGFSTFLVEYNTLLYISRLVPIINPPTTPATDTRGVETLLAP